MSGYLSKKETSRVELEGEDEEKKESPTMGMRNGIKSFAEIKEDSTDRGGESSVCCHKCVVAMRADSVLKPG